MIVILAKEGQMCNQLLTLASAYTLGKKYDDDVFCPVVDEKLKEYFKFENTDDKNKFITVRSSMWEIMRWAIRIYKKIFRIKSEKKYKKANKNNIFTDWESFREDDAFADYIQDLRVFFAFKKDISERCKRVIESIKTNQKVLVGVHIRRGDYAEYENGKFFYSDDEYIYWLKKLSQEMDVRFVLFSNEKVDVELYNMAGLDAVYISGSAIDDLCCLSMCDYIVSPPSTYSLFAAIVGNVPRIILDNREIEINWNDALLTEERIRQGQKIR